MQLILLGTGCPSVDYKRFGPANLILTKKSSILVDCGSGVTQRLKEPKIPLANISALFLTHLHFFLRRLKFSFFSSNIFYVSFFCVTLYSRFLCIQDKGAH